MRRGGLARLLVLATLPGLSACLSLSATMPADERALLSEGADLALHMVYKVEVYQLHFDRYHLSFLLGISPQLITQDYSDELQTGEVISAYVALEDTFLYGWFGQPMDERELAIANRERLEIAVNRARAERWRIAPRPPPSPAPTLMSAAEISMLEGTNRAGGP